MRRHGGSWRRLVWLSSLLLHSGTFSLAVGRVSSLTQLKSLLTQRQSAASRAAVEEAIQSLATAPLDLGPQVLSGRWRLLWSSQTADVNPFATPDEVLGGCCFQEICLSADGSGRLDNVVLWADGWRLIGGAAVAPMSGVRNTFSKLDKNADGKLELDEWLEYMATFRISDAEATQSFKAWDVDGSNGISIDEFESLMNARFILSVDSAVIELGPLPKIDFSFSSFAKLIDTTKRERSEAEGTGAGASELIGRGWLECIYLNEGVRISRDNTGFLYVHQREADTAAVASLS